MLAAEWTFTLGHVGKWPRCSKNRERFGRHQDGWPVPPCRTAPMRTAGVTRGATYASKRSHLRLCAATNPARSVIRQSQSASSYGREEIVGRQFRRGKRTMSTCCCASMTYRRDEAIEGPRISLASRIECAPQIGMVTQDTSLSSSIVQLQPAWPDRRGDARAGGGGLGARGPPTSSFMLSEAMGRPAMPPSRRGAESASGGRGSGLPSSGHAQGRPHSAVDEATSALGQ